MSNIVPFTFEGAAIRVVEIDGEPWFVGKDVAERLGYADPTNAMKQHCRGVVKRHPIVDALGRDQEVRILSEPDVLRLILSSKLPAAERFERWVFEQVLPAIRKTGQYGAPVDISTALEDPAKLRYALLHHIEARMEAERRVAELEPKAQALDLIATGSDGSLCLTDAAKAMQMRPKDFIAALQEKKWIYRRAGCAHWVGYQDKVGTGLLEHKVTEVTRADGSAKITEQVRLTGKGLAKLAGVFGVALNSNVAG